MSPSKNILVVKVKSNEQYQQSVKIVQTFNPGKHFITNHETMEDPQYVAVVFEEIEEHFGKYYPITQEQLKTYDREVVEDFYFMEKEYRYHILTLEERLEQLRKTCL